MPKAGVEPALPWRNQILSLARLPIPPLRRNITTGVAGFEPTHEGVKVPCLTAWLYPNNTNERRSTGIEPASVSATSWCVNHFTTTAIFQTRAAGIEPTPKVLETFVLPLNYARKGNMEGEGFEPPNPKERIYSPPRLASSLPFQIFNLLGWTT